MAGRNSNRKAIIGDVWEKMGKEMSVNTSHEDEKKGQKLGHPFLGWAPSKGQHTSVRWAMRSRKSNLSTWRTTTTNEKDTMKVCVCIYRPVAVFFSLSKAVDIFHALFLSYRQQQAKDDSK